VAVAEAGTTATTEATVRVPAYDPPGQAAAPRGGNAGVSVAWLIAAVLLVGLVGAAIFDIRQARRKRTL
jgi:uncharacterized protein HemX